MSGLFFDELRIPEPDYNLGVGSATQAVQTATIMGRLEPVLVEERPDSVVVYGDVNSTIAAALVASKMGIPVVHVEAGLRSHDFTMPEEINRRLTDAVSSLLLTPSVDANHNLIREGVPEHCVEFIGNVMIDTLLRMLPEAEAEWAQMSPRLQLSDQQYVLVTIHRPSNTDDDQQLRSIVSALTAVAADVPIVFPLHPRTRSRLSAAGITVPDQGQLRIIEPLGYKEFIALQKHAAAVVTDSGGIQEETTYLGVPCLTLREKTERPVTITHGTNRLIGTEAAALPPALSLCLSSGKPETTPPLLWDGNAGIRVAEAIVRKGLGSAVFPRSLNEGYGAQSRGPVFTL
jgi:UDP-N-acetylglucosamine 2-epimerase (non-hydrolysing)